MGERRREPAGIKDLVDRYLRDTGLLRQDKSQDIFSAFERAAGELLAKRARATRFRSGELLIEVSSAAHAYELQNFRAEELRRATNAELGKELIERISFRAAS